MDVFDEIKRLNAGKPEGSPRWHYMGGVTLSNDGGMAVRVFRDFNGYADVVELQPLDNATNDAEGLALLTTGSVILGGLNLAARNRLRSAMDSIGLTMVDLVKDHPNDRDRRLSELARAKWIYGERDESDRVLCYDSTLAKNNNPDCWRIDEEVDGEEGLIDAFRGELD